MAMEIEVIQGDIVTANTEVIVNAANNEFWMGAGVAGAIKAAGGVVIEEEAMNKAPVMPGTAIATTAGKLPFSYVIHGAVMGQNLRTSSDLIRRTTIACLNLAEKLGVSSISFPAFGTGVGGFPVKACATIMIKAVRSYGTQVKKLQRVQFCLFDDVGHKVFMDTLRDIRAADQRV
ncbi:MAG: macro domain-containing protein [candidate division Zixibacteria bacterium]|nr:macro domain-containing protein [candidate division Zixibacteria bacterium]